MDISVITPFYNGNAYMNQLFGCVRRNALAAPGIHIELILVNDSPGCEILYQNEWVDSFVLRIYKNPRNMGIQRTRINGLEQAKGTCVIFLDQDDVIADNALFSQYKLLNDYDIVVSNGYINDGSKNSVIYRSVAHQRQVAYSRFYLTVGCLIISPGQCMLRREIIPEFWKESFLEINGADDYFLWLLLHDNKCRWGINPEILYIHMETGENTSSNLNQMLASSEEALELLKQAGKLCDKQIRIAKRRFQMRRIYQGHPLWRKVVACLLYPDLFLELVKYTHTKIC